MLVPVCPDRAGFSQYQGERLKSMLWYIGTPFPLQEGLSKVATVACSLLVAPTFCNITICAGASSVRTDLVQLLSCPSAWPEPVIWEASALFSNGVLLGG